MRPRARGWRWPEQPGQPPPVSEAAYALAQAQSKDQPLTQRLLHPYGDVMPQRSHDEDSQTEPLTSSYDRMGQPARFVKVRLLSKRCLQIDVLRGFTGDDYRAAAEDFLGPPGLTV